MKQKPLKNVAILIDWDNACRMTGRSSINIPAEKFIRQVLYEIQEKCSVIISDIDGYSKYVCRLRLYHGWHRDRTPTVDRIVFDSIAQDKNFKNEISRRFNRVIFMPEIAFGNEIYGDIRYGMLYNTSRSQGQKMVDTALVCDALSMHASGNFDTVLIVSDDDDFVPALISSEAQGYRTFLVRSIDRNLANVSDIKSCSSIKYWTQA